MTPSSKENLASILRQKCQSWRPAQQWALMTHGIRRTDDDKNSSPSSRASVTRGIKARREREGGGAKFWPNDKFLFVVAKIAA